jgi:hypothetical protein
VAAAWVATLGESWERTSGAELQILGAMLALFILPISILIACSVLFKPEDLVGNWRFAACHECPQHRFGPRWCRALRTD